MAHNKQELEKQSLELIQKLEIPFISHLVTHLPCSGATFYNLELEKLDTIKDAINKVKVSKKTQLLEKMSNSDVAAAQIAAYKLFSDDTEFSKLTGAQVDHTSKGKSVNISVIRDDG